jgi:OFA family oxalate/formate antiporter-like MFS transporter
MMNIRISRKWWIAAAAVVMQLCFGAAYGWSVFVKPLVKSQHWTLTQVSMNFSLAIFCLGIGTVVGGMWLDRVGPRVVASVAGLLYGLGYVLAAFAVAHHSLLGLYLSYGVLAGFGMGMGYICPVSTLVKWFPEKRGLMTGIAVCGYGAGALVMSAIAAPQIAAHGVPVTFLILGAAYAILVIATAQFYQNPPETRLVPGLEARTHATRAAQSSEFSVSEAMRTPQFWLLWTMLFVNVSAGIMIISQASPMSQQLAGFTPVAAAGVVGVIALFNGLGRVVWAAVSDYIGRAPVFVILFAIQAIVLFALPFLHAPILFTGAMALVGFAYGGGFGTMPSFAADFFGAKKIGGIYGWILLAWGAGAVPSPMLIAHVREVSGRYNLALEVIAVLMVCSIALPLLARKPRHPAISSVGKLADALSYD